VLVEAGMSGLPSVATDVGAVSEVVVHGRTGLLVGPEGDGLAAAISAALHDRDRLGGAAHRHCLERFEIGTVADQWDRLLRGLPGVARPS
jgi:glycosyltransferase involved in cell wall biosynthesis